jgi:hypothetical protein
VDFLRGHSLERLVNLVVVFSLLNVFFMAASAASRPRASAKSLASCLFWLSVIPASNAFLEAVKVSVLVASSLAPPPHPVIANNENKRPQLRPGFMVRSSKRDLTGDALHYRTRTLRLRWDCDRINCFN